MNKSTIDNNLIIYEENNININLLSYLDSLKKDELFSLASISLYFDFLDKYKKNLNNLKKYKKNNLINFIDSNKEIIIINILKLSNENIRKNLKYILRHIKKTNIFKNKKLNKITLDFINNNHLGIISTYDNKTKIVMPHELIYLLYIYINNKDIIKASKLYHSTLTFTDSILTTYGLIPLSIYDKFYNNFINNKYLEYYIVCGSLYNHYKLIDTKKNIIIYKNEIKATYIKNTYLNDYKYKKVSKRKIKKIYNLTFLKKNRYFKKFVTYVSLHYIINKKELLNVCLKYVVDYLNISQIDISIANETLKKEFKSEFEVSKQELNLFIKWFNKIYQKYPKWSKKGNN